MSTVLIDLHAALADLARPERRRRDAAARTLDAALRRIARRDLTDPARRATAEDAIQTVLFRLATRPPTLPENVTAYLRRAYRNQLASEHRRRRPVLSDTLDRTPADRFGPSLTLDHRFVEGLDVLDELLRRLRAGDLPRAVATCRDDASRDTFRAAIRHRTERLFTDQEPDARNSALARAERRAMERLTAAYTDPGALDAIDALLPSIAPLLADLRGRD